LPSASGYAAPRALDRSKIPDAIEAWGKAASRAHRAGFDVVELHAARGCLIHSFLSPEANQRSDEYVGSEENRMRFAIEVVGSVRAHWPAWKPLFVRLSIEDEAGWGPAENACQLQVIEAMEANNAGRGANYIEQNGVGYVVRAAGLVENLTDIENIVAATAAPCRSASRTSPTS
jgi:2,4-dienoyl-CoA reductase-like NADH-dependent reductase (Old Yellow Enzyme family)